MLWWFLPYIDMNHPHVCLSILDSPTSLSTASPQVVPEHNFECPASCIKLALCSILQVRIDYQQFLLFYVIESRLCS